MTKIKTHNPVLGVPITFLNYHNPEQFDILNLCASMGNYQKIFLTRVVI